ncbi:MAG: adenylyltransferase/cytidyltransferase family protein [Chlamydiae bacterium]|nr:adenylyltransferase/cytidyltransferase family protein [Chlamydiota bacterium]
MQEKIKNFDEIKNVLEKLKKRGSKIVQCHGVFDLLHPGHIKHFKEAKEQGDTLIVTLTPDRFVNKGPGRPAFNEKLRLESLASLSFIDYVVLNDSPDAVSAIKKIKPNIYVKGQEYKNHKADVTKKIAEEVKAVEEGGGHIFYTDDIVFSSSTLINKYIDPLPEKVLEFVSELKKKYSLEEILEKIEKLSDLKVLVIGDAIIDQYQYVDPLGQSGKGQHMVVNCLDQEIFLGGSLIVSNHLSPFVKDVTLLAGVGNECDFTKFINEKLDLKINKKFISTSDKNTLTKKRYVIKDGETLIKLFESYSCNKSLLDEAQTQKMVSFIKNEAKKYDLILVCDFGNGLINSQIRDEICRSPTFLAINTQTNSGNRGFNVITQYKRADFISLNEPELRLAAHDRYGELEEISKKY